MATTKSPTPLLAELRAGRLIRQRSRPPVLVAGTFLHRGAEELAEGIIKQQHEEQEAAERDRVLQEVTVSEVIDELTAGYAPSRFDYATSRGEIS